MPPSRQTKIVATLGPASSAKAQIRALRLAGADVFRMNFSHGSHEDHAAIYRNIRALDAELGRPIGVLMDLQGPKLRLGTFAEGSVHLLAGARIRFDLDLTPGTAQRVAIPHPEIIGTARVGDTLLIDDGRMRFRVIAAGADTLEAEALTGGTLSNRKGVNVPGVTLPVSALTAKDRADLEFGLALGVDWVALSFVQRPEDLEQVRALIGGKALLMAKIEKPAAIQALDGIIAQSDALMVARGDLGVELPPEEVPGLQKLIVRKCREAGKPVVVATQMLESMISAPSPTRAEASDVATAVYDGVDAVMLSAESASGQYPVEAVEMMARIIQRTEADSLQRKLMNAVDPKSSQTGTDAIGTAIRAVSSTLPLAATVTFTASGETTLRIANQRPHSPIVSVTPSVAVARRLTLVWGVRSCVSTNAGNTDHEMVTEALAACRSEDLDVENLPIALTAGSPFGKPGSTNLLRMVWPEPAIVEAASAA
jgi:pyruvate kinase